MVTRYTAIVSRNLLLVRLSEEPRQETIERPRFTDNAVHVQRWRRVVHRELTVVLKMERRGHQPRGGVLDGHRLKRWGEDRQICESGDPNEDVSGRPIPYPARAAWRPQQTAAHTPGQTPLE